MTLTEETPVPQAALPVEAFKAHLRLGTGFAEAQVQDAVLESFLRAALAAIEARTGKILIWRDFSWRLVRWQSGEGQALPVAPVVSLDAVTLIDRDGVEAPVPLSRLRLEPDDQRPFLRPHGGSLPGIPTGGAVRVRFVAGMAADWGGLPADLAQAVLLLAAHYYEYRHETALSGGCMPFGVTSLIERYKTVRLLAGRGA